MKSICEQYLEQKDAIQSITTAAELIEQFEVYVLFGELMQSDRTDTRFLSDLWRLLVTSIKSFTPALLFPDESVPFFVNQSNITK